MKQVAAAVLTGMLTLSGMVGGTVQTGSELSAYRETDGTADQTANRVTVSERSEKGGDAADESLVGRKAPNATVYNDKGSARPLSDLLDGRVTVAAVWTTWCGTCPQTFQTLATLAGRHDDDRLAVIGINMTSEETSPAAARQFVRGSGADFRIAYDVEGDFLKKYAVRQVPVFFLIDHYGTVVHVFGGDATPEEIERWLPQP